MKVNPLDDFSVGFSLGDIGELPFTAEWVRANGDKRLSDAACARLADGFNRLYAQAQCRRAMPSVCIRTTPGHTLFYEAVPWPVEPGRRWRWTGPVRLLSTMICVEMNATQPIKKGRTFGYTKDGPVVQFLHKVIPLLIPGEHPSVDAIETELRRQRPSG